MAPTTPEKDKLLDLTAQIVTAHLANKNVPTNEVAQLVADVHKNLSDAASGAAAAHIVLKPAVPIDQSVKKHAIVCLDDGTEHKMLRRHLMHRFGITPEQYRQKWNLPADYPMTAPDYSKVRSKLAKDLGLGTKKIPVTKKKGGKGSGKHA